MQNEPVFVEAESFANKGTGFENFLKKLIFLDDMSKRLSYTIGAADFQSMFPNSVAPVSLTDQEICELVSTWTRRLVLFARQWTDSVDDVVQDVFLKLCELPTPPDDVVSWLFRATRNAAMIRRRSEMARTRRENAVALANPKWFQSLDENRLDGETAKEKLQELPPELQEVVVARLWGGLSFEQIADLTDSARSTTRRRYYEAIELLRKRLAIE